MSVCEDGLSSDLFSGSLVSHGHFCGKSLVVLPHRKRLCLQNPLSSATALLRKRCAVTPL